MSIKFLSKLTNVCVFMLVLSNCSISHFPIRISSYFIEQRIATLNSEKNLEKAQKQLPDDIVLLEKMLAKNKQNKKLRIYAAQAYYSYAFAFLEDTNKKNARLLYYQSYQHSKAALASHGIWSSDLDGRSPLLRQKIRSLPKDAVEALYWTAVSWAKLIEINQPDILSLTQLHKTAILMEQVIKLDDSYQLAGPYLFFAVYYGGRPAYLGGDNALAVKYFEQARRFNGNRLLIVDFLQAKYLDEGINGRERFNRRLLKIIKAPDDLYPEQALMNAVAKLKASRLLLSYQKMKKNSGV